MPTHNKSVTVTLRRMSKPDNLELLKDILFMEDREYAEKIARKMDILEKTIHNKKEFSKHIDPLVDEKLSSYTENIPYIVRDSITNALKQEIKRSKEDVVDILYPLLGRMVQKSVANEMRVISEKINHSLRFKFSSKSMGRKVKSWFGNVKESEIVLNDLAEASIQQVLLIKKGSGAMVASFAKTKTIDEDMVSGMLTAIKNFVEDAFVQQDQNLEHIEYQSYHIHIQNFMAYYVAVVISGNYTATSKINVQEIIYAFYSNFTMLKLKEEVTAYQLNQELIKSFGNAVI